MSRETAFNLEQFTPGAIAAMKANPAAMKAIHAATHGGKLFPSLPGSESADADDDSDTSEHSDLGMAADLINCEVSGESGPGCGHNCDQCWHEPLSVCKIIRGTKRCASGIAMTPEKNKLIPAFLQRARVCASRE